VTAFAACQFALFVGGTWLALAVGTGVWHPAYLLSVPVLVALFVILYSFSTLLAVWTRSTVVCVFGTLLFWGACSAVDHARYRALARAEPAGPGAASPLAEAGYWVLPKPADCLLLLDDALESDRHFGQPAELGEAVRGRAFSPELSLLTSLVFSAALVGLAGWRFVNQDY
jgi:hypothetical protein